MPVSQEHSSFFRKKISFDLEKYSSLQPNGKDDKIENKNAGKAKQSNS